jgi:hypothetical protein
MKALAQSVHQNSPETYVFMKRSDFVDDPVGHGADGADRHSTVSPAFM